MGRASNLSAHPEDDIGIAAPEVPDGEVHPSLHPNSQQPKQVLHHCFLFLSCPSLLSLSLSRMSPGLLQSVLYRRDKKSGGRRGLQISTAGLGRRLRRRRAGDRQAGFDHDNPETEIELARTKENPQRHPISVPGKDGHVSSFGGNGLHTGFSVSSGTFGRQLPMVSAGGDRLQGGLVNKVPQKKLDDGPALEPRGKIGSP